MGLSALCRSSVAATLRSWTCRSILGLAAMLAPAAAHAQSIETTYANNNGGASLWTMFFDVSTTSPITIGSFDVNCGDAAGAPVTLDVFITAVGGTWVGNTNNAGLWTQVSTGSGTTAGVGQHTSVDVADFTLSTTGTYGIAIRYTGGFPSYTNGTGANQSFTDGTVTLSLGCSQVSTAGPFTGALNNPRVWNGTMFYTLVGGVGACCAPNNTCTVGDLLSCTSPSIRQANGTTCSGPANTCPGDVGRCCNNATGVCTFVAGAANCANGTYGGSGTTCSTACAVTASCCNSITGACSTIFGGSCPAGSTQGATNTCNPNPCSTAPSICEGLESVSAGSLPAGWSSLVVSGAGADWTVVSGAAHTGTNAVFTNDVASASEQVLTTAPFTANGNLILDFWSNFTTETNWDGFVVEYSTDGGGSWTDVGLAGWLLNGYNATLNAGSANPLTGQPAFSGAFPTWTERACSIPAASGQQVTIRFRMGSDGSVASIGVNLDDICVYNIQVGSGACCASDGACAVSSNTTCTGLFRGVGTTCGAGGTCPGEFGKCCNNTSGACVLVGGAAACGATSTYGGNNTTCATACVSSATCCNPSTAACIAIFGGSCPAGLELGSGTACGPTACQYGACCGGCAGCTITSSTSCSGSYAGNGTACATACVNDGYSVAVSPTTVTYIPATNDIGLYADDATQAISLPFDVSFYGTTYSSVTASTNGNIQFTTANGVFGNICLPANTILGPAIFAFWDDMYTVDGGAAGNGSGIFTETTGTAPNRTFVIEWRAVYCCTAGAPINDLEVLFYEGQNFFDVVYATPMADRSSATIGVQSNGTAGSPFTQFICNTAGPVSGDAIRFACGSAATNGACCNNTSGACSSTTQGTCPSGSTFQGVGTLCNPNPCPQPPSGVCCRGATCSTTLTSAAACSGTLIGGQTAGASFPTGASCNTTGVTNTPCCYADYNKLGGITVNDIFDFLNDWFAGSPYANTGGTGAAGPLAVQNIFDFLNAWFAGGC